MDLSTLQAKLFHGSLAGLARVVLAVPVYCILTPLVLRTLGPEQFGIWSFSTIVISLMNLTDFGLKNSLTYLVAKHADRPDEINRYFSTTMWMYLALSSLLLIGTAVWGQEVMCTVLKVPDRYRDEAMFVLWITVGGFVWRLLSLPYQALVEGHQELAKSQMISLAWVLVHFVASLGALAVSPTIYGLGVAGLIGNIFIFLAFYWTARRRFPHLALGHGVIDGVQLRHMFRFGLGIQVASICIALREPLYKVLVARSFDLASVATFDIAFRLCTQLMSVITTPLLGVFGAAALLAARREDLWNVLRPLVGMTLGGLLPATMAVLSFAQPLMYFWLAPEDVEVGAILPVMCVAFAVYYATEALYRTIEGTGQSGYSAVVQTVVLAVQIGTFWLFSSHHLSSASWSILVGYALFSLSNLWMFRAYFPSGHLLTYTQWLSLLGPSCLYGVSLALIPIEARPIAFGMYLILHTGMLLTTRIVDVRLLWHQLTRKRTAARSALLVVGRRAE